MGALHSIRAHSTPLKSRRAMLDTLLKHLDMVRLSIGFMAVVALMGCTGLIDPSGQSLTPEQRIAQQKWLDKALPVLKQNCGQCHAGSQPDIAFIAGDTDLAIRDTLVAFDPQVVNTDAPGSSRLLTKKAHAGPEMLTSQISDVLEWIQAEKDAVGGSGSGSGGPLLETAPFVPLLCTCVQSGSGTSTCVPGVSVDCPINHVDLAPIGLAGATIDFVAIALGSTDLYINDLVLTAATDGAYIEHPLFVSRSATKPEPIPDSLDRFFNVKLNLMATTKGTIGAGTAAFVGFAPANQLTIHFKVVSPYKAETGSGSGSGSGSATGGCKRLTEFKANAQAGLKANCASCHTGAGGGKSSLDLTGIGATDDPTILLACNQVRTSINFQDTNQSGFFIAPNPAVASNHPFKFGGVQATFNTFKSAVDIWVQAEKTAP